MSRVTEGRMEEGGEGRSGARSDEPEARSEVRWSARRKEEVERLLAGAAGVRARSGRRAPPRRAAYLERGVAG